VLPDAVVVPPVAVVVPPVALLPFAVNVPPADVPLVAVAVPPVAVVVTPVSLLPLAVVVPPVVMPPVTVVVPPGAVVVPPVTLLPLAVVRRAASSSFRLSPSSCCPLPLSCRLPPCCPLPVPPVAVVVPHRRAARRLLCSLAANRKNWTKPRHIGVAHDV
jgi:hypothetical protein